MEEFEKYIFVACLKSIAHYRASHNYFAFTALEFEEALKQHYSVEFPASQLQQVFEKAAKAASDANSIEHIKSPFASDRFYLNIAALGQLSNLSTDGALWDRATSLGDKWLGEALLNIRSMLNSGELSADYAQPLETKSIPASDRYVSIHDNQEAFDDLRSGLEELRREVRNSNSIEDENRLIALSEIALFEAAICQPRLAQDIIERFLGFCVTKLSNWIGGAALGYLIDKLKALIDLFISSLSSAV